MAANVASSQTVDRPRLTERFRAGRTRRLTLVVAPLGYGKTTLIEVWTSDLLREGYKVASVAFEDALRDKFERVAQALADLGMHFDEETGLTPLPNTSETEPGSSRRCFLVLDDFHEADDACRAFVQTALRGNDHGLHIILGSREPPGIPLTKLRMAELVNDFDTADLRFDLAEAHDLFRGDLSESELESYLERAEGWVAALQLLRQFGLGRDGPPPDFDQLAQFGEYLNEQYFGQLNCDQQTFLLQTAHVERVDGDLANWLTQRDDGWLQLQTLSAANALIFAQNKSTSTTYRYHPLLRDYLRRKQQYLGQDHLKSLHEATSRWFAETGTLFEAMHHARLAGDPERVQALLEEAGGVQYGMLHGAGRLAACLEVLTPDQVLASPRLLLVRTYVLLKTGRIREAADLLKDIRTRHQAGDDVLEREIILLEAHLRGYADTGMTRQRLDALEHAVIVAPFSDPLTRGMLSNFLSMFLIEFGDFAKAREYADQAMALYRDIGAQHLQFFMHLHLSAIDLEITTLAPAIEARKKALDLCHAQFASDPSLNAIAEIYYGETLFEAGEIEGLAERLRGSLLRIDRMEGWNMLYLAGYETCLSLLIEDERFEAAVELCDHAGKMVTRRGMTQFSNQLLAMQLDLAVRAGARSEARRLAGELDRLLTGLKSDESLRWRGRVRAELAMARYETEHNAEKAALARISRMVRFCASHGLSRLMLRVLVRKFCLEARLENAAACRETLMNYLAHARNHGSFGAVLRERAAFREAALWLVMSEGLGSFDPTDIRVLASSLWHASGQTSARSGNVLAGLLTDREIGVLDELAKGHANKVIARTLEVTEPTVKFHLQNIYRKLGVNSRKLAIEIATQYGGKSTEMPIQIDETPIHRVT